jgi:hypothetical protein
VEPPAPIITDEYSVYERDGYQMIDGCWVLQWKIKPRFESQEEYDEYEQEKLRGNIEFKWSEIRNERNLLLSKTDFTQLADSPMSSEIKLQFIEYRQLLRNITKQSDPFNIIWPTKPVDF